MQQHGASQDIRNNEGQTPADLLSLTFDQAKKLLEFHTSPDLHPDTFRLDEKEFHDQSNLEKIIRGVKFERKIVDVKGKTTEVPGKPLHLNTIEAASIFNDYEKISMIINEGATDLKKAIRSFQDRINLLNFMQEDGPLILQRLPWKDYLQERTAIDNKLNGLTNPYMFDMDETGYKKYQDWINEAEAEAQSVVQKNIHEITDMKSKLEHGINVLKMFELKEAALKNDEILVQKLINEGVDTQIITDQLQQELAALQFKRTLQTLVTSLFQGKAIEWKDFDDQIKAALNNAGGTANPYLPNSKLRLYKTQAEFDELIQSISEEEVLNFLKTESDKLAETFTKYDNALKLIHKAPQVLQDVDFNPSELVKDYKSKMPRSGNDATYASSDNKNTRK